VGKLIVIEGVDGAGKNTLARALTAELHGAGATVMTMAFPRYGQDVHADLIRDGLHGRLGDLTESVYGFGLLFALDRRDAADELRETAAEADVLLVDRYIASNAAYGAARLHEGADGAFAQWVRALEVEKFEVPVPDAQILLRVPAAVAADRSKGRAKADEGRGRDTWESDDALQARVAAVYDELAAQQWLAPWHVVDGTHTVDAAALAADLGFGANAARSGHANTDRGEKDRHTAGSSGNTPSISANMNS
jgi:dTMP kinase